MGRLSSTKLFVAFYNGDIASLNGFVVNVLATSPYTASPPAYAPAFPLISTSLNTSQYVFNYGIGSNTLAISHAMVVVDATHMLLGYQNSATLGTFQVHVTTIDPTTDVWTSPAIAHVSNSENGTWVTIAYDGHSFVFTYRYINITWPVIAASGVNYTTGAVNLYGTRGLCPIGIVQEAKSAGSEVRIVIFGRAVTARTNLVPGEIYYLGTDGSITSLPFSPPNSQNCSVVALSETEVNLGLYGAPYATYA